MKENMNLGGSALPEGTEQDVENPTPIETAQHSLEDMSNSLVEIGKEAVDEFLNLLGHNQGESAIPDLPPSLQGSLLNALRDIMGDIEQNELNNSSNEGTFDKIMAVISIATEAYGKAMQEMEEQARTEEEQRRTERDARERVVDLLEALDPTLKGAVLAAFRNGAYGTSLPLGVLQSLADEIEEKDHALTLA